MKIGYARVSTLDQNPELQIEALKDAGCSKIFSEKESGCNADRPELLETLKFVREDDILVVWKLDRLARSTKHLIEIIEKLDEQKVGFQSLTENIDTNSAGGKLVFTIFAGLAEFEKSLNRERTMAGLENAKANGRVGGRPTKLTDEDKTDIRELLANGNRISDVCKQFGISRSTLYRAIA